MQKWSSNEIDEQQQQKILSLVGTGATSHAALGRMIAPEELQGNVVHVEWMRQSASFATNKIFLSSFF